MSNYFRAGFERILHFAFGPYTISVYSGLEGLGFSSKLHDLRNPRMQSLLGYIVDFTSRTSPHLF